MFVRGERILSEEWQVQIHLQTILYKLGSAGVPV